MMVYRDRSSDGYANNVQGNYILITDKIGGVSGTPSQIRVYNTPVVPADNEDRSTDPDGGRSIAQLNTVTLRLEPHGSQKLAAINILNLRASRDFPLGHGVRFGIDVDVFNPLNSSAPTSATFASGPTFGYVIGVVPARIGRIGGRLRF